MTNDQRKPVKVACRSIKAWRKHELIVKAIYEALLKQSRVTNLEVGHNAIVRGIAVKHQVDVFWSFKVADIAYDTIVQVKKEKRRATLAEMLTFASVIEDIPGKPTGLFVSEAGFQRGALDFARTRGIMLFQLTELQKPPPSEMTMLSFGVLEANFNTLVMRMTIYNPRIRSINFLVDRAWADEHATDLLADGMQEFKVDWAVTRLVNASGEEVSTLAEYVRKFVGENRKGGEIFVEFTEPVFVLGLKLPGPVAHSVDRIKLLNIKIVLDVEKTIRESAFSADSYRTYVLEGITDGSRRFVLVDGGGVDPRATVSLRRIGENQQQS
jgi:hypothetical protein